MACESCHVRNVVARSPAAEDFVFVAEQLRVAQRHAERVDNAVDLEVGHDLRRTPGKGFGVDCASDDASAEERVAHCECVATFCEHRGTYGDLVSYLAQ